MLWYETFDAAAAERLPGLHVAAEEPMARHTSFRIGGPARRMAFPADEGELVRLLHLTEALDVQPLVLGNGTNVLYPDEGIDRLVINTRDLSALRMGEGEGEVVAEAGVQLARLANFACAAGLTGLEFAHGIPGSVGGAVCMNAGAYGGEIRDVIVGADVWFPGAGVRFVPREELQLSYRHSLLDECPDAVVLSAVFRLERGDSEVIRAAMDELMARRKKSQPLEYPSAGSTFKRPAGYFAGALIQEAGLKGTAVGGAMVSPKHAGFVINTGNATCADVLGLIRLVQERVRETAGVELEPEVRIIH